MQTQPVSARRNTSIALDRELVQRARAHGSQAGVIEDALRAFLERPDLEIPREPLTARDLQVVRVDDALLLRVKHFALDQHERRGKRVTKRAIVEEVLRAHLDALDQAATLTGEPSHV
jgi:predicted transcriptional regulator